MKGIKMSEVIKKNESRLFSRFSSKTAKVTVETMKGGK